MRLIDADYLVKTIEKAQIESRKVNVLSLINDMPTITINANAIEHKAYCKGLEDGKKIARPKGKWIEHEDYCGDTYYTCSNCGGDWCTIEGTPVDNMMNFCPNCGADMRSTDEGLHERAVSDLSKTVDDLYKKLRGEA